MGNNIKIKSLNISEKKGTIKFSRNQAEITETGIRGDAHSGSWNRQISMLGLESIRKYERQMNRQINYGEFAENITTEGFLIYNAHPLDRFVSGSVIFEVTQIGKKCHGDNCAIFKETGNCVMPKEGVFCRVITGGLLHEGDMLEYIPKTYKLKVITLSDRASAGIYKDRSGEIIVNELEKLFASNGLSSKTEKVIIPDDDQTFSKELEKAVEEKCDVIISTGSTGLGSRDIAPSIIHQHLDKELPGIMELIRVKYGMDNPKALLSRSVAGVIDKTLLFGLPGSTKAVGEYMHEITGLLKHAIYMLYDIDDH